MERANVSTRIKGKLANWYNTLDDKSYHVKEALRMYVEQTGINLSNYTLNSNIGNSDKPEKATEHFYNTTGFKRKYFDEELDNLKVKPKKEINKPKDSIGEGESKKEVTKWNFPEK